MKVQTLPPAEDWFEYGAVLLLAGDRDGYRSHAKAMIDRLGSTTDPLLAFQFARTVALDPAACGDPGRLTEWAKVANSGTPNSSPWSLHLLGLAHFRAGRDADSIQSLDRAIAAGPDWQGIATNWLALALALGRQGDAETASGFLKRADRRFAEVSQSYPGVGLRAAGVVHPSDWLEWQVLRREVKAASSAGGSRR